MPNLAMMFSHTDLAIYSRLGCCVEVCGPVFFVLHTMAVLPLKFAFHRGADFDRVREDPGSTPGVEARVNFFSKFTNNQTKEQASKDYDFNQTITSGSEITESFPNPLVDEEEEDKVKDNHCYYISIRQVKEELKTLERACNSEQAIYLKKEELLELRKKKKEVCTESTSSLEEEMVPSGTPLPGQEANLRAAWAHLCDMFECNGPDRFAEEAKQTQNDDGELIHHRQLKDSEQVLEVLREVDQPQIEVRRNPITVSESPYKRPRREMPDSC